MILQLLTMLRQEYQPLLLVFTALLLLMVFCWQHCQILYQDMVLFQQKGDYQRHFANRILHPMQLVEQLLTVNSEFEERLRRSQFVPKFSFGRWMLRDDGARNRVSLMYLFCEKSNAIQS